MSKNAPQEVLETMGAEIGELAENGIMDTVLKVGAKMPNFELKNSDGDLVSLNNV